MRKYGVLAGLTVLFLSITGCGPEPTASNQAMKMSTKMVTNTGTSSTQIQEADLDWIPVHHRKVEQPAVVPESIQKRLEMLTKIDRFRDLRKFPYPYQAMLAVSSDIDDTTPEEFAEYHQFLNTKESTPHGQGLGLDIADSMWMYMGNDQPNRTDQEGHYLEQVMTYFDHENSKRLHNADLIQYYFKAGWIDSMHTFGDFSRKNHNDIAFTRSLAVDAWQAIKEAGLAPKVWINHGNEANKQNFGAYNPSRFSKYQEGDKPGSQYYHTDITIKNGIRFVWNSDGSPQFGYDSPIFPIELRDQQRVWGFHRYTNEWKNGQIDWTWNPRDLHRQITKERLQQLIQKHQYAIVAQHLGGYNIGFPFQDADIDTLRMVANQQDDGNLLVARTSRMLTYAVSQQFVQYAKVTENGKTWINIQSIPDPIFGSQKPSLEDIRGLTFYTESPEDTVLFLNMKPLQSSEINRNPADVTREKSISIKWFAPDYTNYTKTTSQPIYHIASDRNQQTAP